jgi:hypothetical protein
MRFAIEYRRTPGEELPAREGAEHSGTRALMRATHLDLKIEDPKVMCPLLDHLALLPIELIKNVAQSGHILPGSPSLAFETWESTWQSAVDE